LAPVNKKILAPGDSTVVELVFGTKTSKGKITKNARIMSNDSTRAVVTIDFSGNIVVQPDTTSLIRVAPDQMQFGKDAKKGSVTVENHSGTQIKLQMVNQPMDQFKYKFGPNLINGGDSRKLEFEWKGKTPEYDINHVFTFETGDMNVSRISIPYTIKGEKGPKPTPAGAHGAPPKAATPATTTPGSAVSKPVMGNQNGKTDSLKTVNPIPGTPWPPK
jgi:hypothetical protein